jgi:FkbM family methyltransferase
MPTIDAHLHFMERMRKTFGFWVNLFRIREVTNLFLSWIPVYARHERALLRIRCWSDILAFSEIFCAGVYDKAFDEDVTTYCDLGCQSGMSLLRLASRRTAPRHSVLVDANPRAVARCTANLLASNIPGVHVLHGAVACGIADRGTAKFTLRPNELECSLAAEEPAGRNCTVIDVPTVALEPTWLRHVGDLPCDLLKMDIEGAELAVLLNEQEFLKRVRRCVLEWHSPPLSREAVLNLLRQRGFSEIDLLYDGPTSGLLYCRRPNIRPMT